MANMLVAAKKAAQKYTNGGPQTTTNGEGDDVPMTRKQYRKKIKQARWSKNIELAREGKLGEARTQKIRNIIGTVKDAIGTASDVKNIVTPSLR